MKTILALIAALCFAAASRADAVEYHAYLATVSLPMLDGEYVSGNDRIVTTRLSSKQLINLALGRTFSTVVPPEQTLVLLVPKAGPPEGSRVVVLDKNTGSVLATIATIDHIYILSPDNIAKPSSSMGQATVKALSNIEATFRGLDAAATFTLRGSGTGTSVSTPDGPQLTLTATLAGTFERTLPFGLVARGVLAKGSFRASGKPIASVTLP